MGTETNLRLRNLWERLREIASANIMGSVESFWSADPDWYQLALPQNWRTTLLNEANPDALGMDGVAQRTYLLGNRDHQRRIFEENGYTYIEPVSPELYGMVRTAATKLSNKRRERIPIYQKNPDAISKDKLIPIKASYNHALDGHWLGDYGTEQPFFDAGNYPIQLYYDPETLLMYQVGYDLNDYGSTSSTGGTARDSYSDWDIYNLAINTGQELLDEYGLPTVLYTGVQPVLYNGSPLSLTDVLESKFVNLYDDSGELVDLFEAEQYPYYRADKVRQEI